MATKKTAAKGAAKKASKKGASAEPKPATKAASGKKTLAAAPTTKRGRGPSVSPEQIRQALTKGPAAISTIAETVGAGKHAVRAALKKMGAAVTSTGTTVDKKYALAS